MKHGIGPIESRRRLKVDPDIKADLDEAFRQIREEQRREELSAANEVGIGYALLFKGPPLSHHLIAPLAHTSGLCCAYVRSRHGWR